MRHWTLPEANAALPEVRRLLADGRGALDRLREAHDQLEDLRIVPGPSADEKARWRQAHEEARADCEAIGLKFAALGIELKDLEMGLVDFRARLGEHDVYLCWRSGEPEIGWWHALDGGFARRRPVPDFTPVA